MEENLNAFDQELLEIFNDKLDTVKTKLNTLIKTKIIEKECGHTTTFENQGLAVCKDCGCEIETLDFQAEWRFYGASDTRSGRDPSRCHKSKDAVRGGIDKVFQDAKLSNLPLSIRAITEQKYRIVVGDTTVRGRGRKGIVAACLMYAYRDDNDIRTSDEIRTLFGLDKQEMSLGLSKYHATFPKDRVKKIRPVDLIRRIMTLSKVSMLHYKSIIRIAGCLENVDLILQRSSPQAVAAATVYLYLCLRPDIRENMGFTKTQFASDVKISDITISKLVKRAAAIIETKA